MKLGLALLLAAVPAAADDDPSGAALYERLCVACHGVGGAGDGPAAHLWDPPPADIARGTYKWRSTSSGEAPRLADIERTIGAGVAGTGMPAFAGSLTRSQITAIALHVRSLSPRLAARAEGRSIGRPALPAFDVGRGRAVWERAQCGSCHGPGGRGDGPAAARLRNEQGGPADVYDLTLAPPRGGRGVDDVVRSLRTGLDGTPMPSYEGAITLQEMADVAAFVRSLQTPEAGSIRADGSDDPRLPASFGRRTPDPPPPRDARTLAIERDLFWFPLRAQGPPPAHLTPAEASLDPAQCGRCHAKQHEEWRTSVHARALGPGFVAQIHDGTEDWQSCKDCHAPLAEQDSVDADLSRGGLTCAGCHLRDWERHGPPIVDPRRQVPANYPLTVLGRYERADFCLPCHQHDLLTLVGGKPLLDTFREYVRSPYFRRGFTCQSCHMSDRSHTWRGAHDPDAVRAAFRVEASACADGDGRPTATVRIENAGAGHMLPTTPTPEARVHFALLDPGGEVVDGTEKTVEIGRHVTAAGGEGWRELRDTRLAPGERRRIEWTTDARGDAVRVRLEWRPDRHYERLFADRLRRRPSEPAASEYQEALRAAQTSPFTVYARDLDLVPCSQMR